MQYKNTYKMVARMMRTNRWKGRSTDTMHAKNNGANLTRQNQ